MPPRRSRLPVSRKKPGSSNWTAAGVHGALILGFSAVWLWHLTPEANKQEVAQKEGWFWQYYTFAGFTLQLVQFVIALLADIQGKGFLVQLADDVSCAVLPVATFITASYYCLLFTGNIVDSDQVPVWVSPALHTGNFAGLLTDLYVAREHRTFRVSSSILAAVINLIYMAFCYYTRLVNGSYPYAFLDKAPEPHGIIISAVALIFGVEALFIIARLVKRSKLLR